MRAASQKRDGRRSRARAPPRRSIGIDSLAAPVERRFDAAARGVRLKRCRDGSWGQIGVAVATGREGGSKWRIRTPGNGRPARRLGIRRILSPPCHQTQQEVRRPIGGGRLRLGGHPQRDPVAPGQLGDVLDVAGRLACTVRWGTAAAIPERPVQVIPQRRRRSFLTAKVDSR
jgi:hypothetical protein